MPVLPLPPLRQPFLLLLPALLVTACAAVVLSAADAARWAAPLARVADAIGMPYPTLVVLLGTGLLGLACGAIGAFAVLRRRALVSDAVSHAALPGIAIAFLLLGDRRTPELMFGALLSGLAGVGLIAWIQRSTVIKADAAIGLVLGGFFGLGVMLTSIANRTPSGKQSGLESYLLGKAASLVLPDVLLLAVVSLAALAVLALYKKEFATISFDPTYSATLGWPVLLLDTLLMSLIVVLTVTGLPAAGVVLMSALLILPAVAARFWTERLTPLLLLSGGFGVLSSSLGTLASAQVSKLSTGPAIVLAGGALFLISMLCAPRRGVLARLLLERALRRRTDRQSLLRTLYELSESPAAAAAGVAPATLAGHRTWQGRPLETLLREAQARGELERTSGTLRLTPAGRTAAAQLVRAQRLMELYLVEFAAAAADPAGPDAGELEKALPPEILQQLEQRLAAHDARRAAEASAGSPANARSAAAPAPAPLPEGGPR